MWTIKTGILLKYVYTIGNAYATRALHYGDLSSNNGVAKMQPATLLSFSGTSTPSDHGKKTYNGLNAARKHSASHMGVGGI